MTVKDELRQLVELLPDDLPEASAGESRRALHLLREAVDNPLVMALLCAPYDDEPETLEEAMGALKARFEYDRGEARLLEDVLAEWAARGDEEDKDDTPPGRSKASGE